MRTHGRPLAGIAGNADHVVLDDHVRCELLEDLGETLVDVARAVDERLPGRCDEPLELLERALAETGAVSRMKSFQNWPGTSVWPAAAPRRINRSSKPFASSVPLNDSSTTKTTR